MYKWMYDRMVEEYGKESKEELAQRIMSLEEIECADRSFANECKAGSAIYDIEELFSALDDLQSGFSYKKMAKVYELLQSAKGSWNYIVRKLVEISDPCRSSKTLDDFRNKVNNAKDNMDSI